MEVSLIKDVGLLYKEAWALKADVKEDLRRSNDLEERWWSRVGIIVWWFLFLLIHAVIIGIPAGVIFLIMGHMGAFG